MTKIEDFFKSLLGANTVVDVGKALVAFENQYKSELTWTAVGNRDNNRGIIDVATDTGRSLVERVTNAVDAVIEEEFERHKGIPECRSPREAAGAWLGVPSEGLSGMTQKERRDLAHRIEVKLSEGDGRRESRTIEVRDFGIGLKPDQMAETILSLNASNKWQKHYLAGTYGQGGSSTLASSKYTLIATRYGNHPVVGFTVVRYDDLPADLFKTGHYVYLVLNGVPLQAEIDQSKFPPGTLVKHFGYDLSSYPSPVGPNSLYGLFNEVLFDPILPVWLDSRLHDYRRVIKGSRNALNGAVDEGDTEKRGPRLSHSVRMFYVSIGDFGQIGIEYWVLEKPSKENKRPTAAFVNPSKPIVLTVNGQNHEEMTILLVRKAAELPYLTQRLICHVDCNHLTPEGKRALFASTREGARRGLLYDLIQQELIKVFRSDDDLVRLNDEARQEGMREMDQSAVQQMRKEVAKILRLHGLDISEAVGGSVSTEENQPTRPTHPRKSHPKPQPIDLHEPPTYIRIVWENGKEIPFYPDQRRYIRIETDAESRYHSSTSPDESRMNFIVSGDVILRGSTPLQGGRLRVVLQGTKEAKVGNSGTVRVELTRKGLSTLSDERSLRIVETPPVKQGERKVTVPPFDVRAVEGQDDPRWTEFGWPDNVNNVASSAEMENGTLVVYFSTVFPKYANQRAGFEAKDTSLANSFTERYKIWLAVHSLLLYQDQQVQAEKETKSQAPEAPVEFEEEREREERCRIATLSTLFAARETSQLPVSGDASD
ncbi:MAG: hypothetical protein WEB37_11125 [Bacteroidota bacterium]